MVQHIRVERHLQLQMGVTLYLVLSLQQEVVKVLQLEELDFQVVLVAVWAGSQALVVRAILLLLHQAKVTMVVIQRAEMWVLGAAVEPVLLV